MSAPAPSFEPNPTLVELAAMGDRSPDDESLRETLKLLEECQRIGKEHTPVSNRKVIELTDSLLAIRAAYRRACDRIALLESVARERDALNADVIEAARATLAGVDNWNIEVQKIIGRVPDYRWGALEELRAALAAHDAEREART